MKKTEVCSPLGFALAAVLAMVCINPSQLIAQPSESAEKEPAQESSSSDTNAEIIKELQRMRDRIQELESQLKQRGPSQSSTPSTVEHGTAPETKNELSSSSPKSEIIESSPAPNPVTASDQPQKAEPFAYADWKRDYGMVA